MLIGITGGSGSGKSTVSKYLLTKLGNAKRITVDNIMEKNLVILYGKDIMKEFNQKEYNPIELFESIEAVNKWMNICGENIYYEIEELIEKYSSKYENIIVDFCFLPMLDTWDECDMTINVKADTDIRYDRLKQRLINTCYAYEWINEISLSNRLKATSLDEYGYKSQYTVYNNGSYEELTKQVDEVLRKRTIKKLVI